MPTTNTPIYPQTITNGLVQILNADAQNLKTIYTGGANGSKVEMLIVTSTDTADRDVQFSIVNGGITYIIGTVKIPLNSGNTNSVVTVNILLNAQMSTLPRDANGNPYIYLANGSVLKAEALTTVTSGKTISIISSGGDY